MSLSYITRCLQNGTNLLLGLKQQEFGVWMSQSRDRHKVVCAYKEIHWKNLSQNGQQENKSGSLKIFQLNKLRETIEETS